jgi:HAD superfamily hydrolase (TIGR01509 family)
MGVAAPAAVLFDMDGLLVDTERLWLVAQEELARSLGAVLTAQIKHEMMGRGGDPLAVMFTLLGIPNADPVAAAAFLLARTAELFREPGAIVLRPGAAALLSLLGQAGIPLALVSSSHRDLLDAVFDAVGHGHFVASVAGDEVTRRKPDPEPYLRAAALLGVSAADCVVLEDSASGALAGIAAGCRTVLVPSVRPVPAVPVAAVVPSLREVTLTMLSGLFALE